MFLKILLLALAVVRRNVWKLLLRLVLQIHLKFLNLVDNDVELGINEGTTNLVNNMATLSGSSFMNVDNSSTRTTPIIDKIWKFEELLTCGQAILVDKAGIPLKKVEFLGDYDSEDKVALVDNDMAHSMALEKPPSDVVGVGALCMLQSTCFLAHTFVLSQLRLLFLAIINLVLQKCQVGAIMLKGGG
uniref:Uncharacterized protein n=1 Tax=Tanacetum cinerariifolium TaxID=118510 RepID=A0A6L2MH43_TANCI|nr:hypothetical protein [Tanacetum cinerariifolium]